MEFGSLTAYSRTGKGRRMEGTILTPLDGSRRAEAAVTHAASLAARMRARLLLVRAVRARRLPNTGETGSEREVAFARTYLHRVADTIHARLPYLSVGMALPYGPAPEAILDEALLQRIDLIVMTTRGQGMIAPWGLGHTARAIADRADVPVLFIRSPVPASPGALGSQLGLAGDGGERSGVPWLKQRLRVLVPLDGSAAAEAALPVVVQLDSNLDLDVTLAPALRRRSSVEGSGLFASPVPPLASRGACATAAYCEQVADWLQQHGVAAHVEGGAGDVIDLIEGASLGIDAIVVGSPSVRRPEWGSGDDVCDRLLHVCRRPVFLVRTQRTEPFVPPVTAIASPSPDREMPFTAAAGHRRTANGPERRP